MDRQLRPIYDALDTGSSKSAILACNKVLKKHPNNLLVKALKALALVRSQKVEEALLLCDEVLASKPVDDPTLTAMMHVLRGLGRHSDMLNMFEEAWKLQPANEELGSQCFIANARLGKWKVAQQLATRLHKQFQEDHYLYWNAMSAVLQAEEPETPPALRTVLYKLAQRHIASCQSPSFYSADRFHLHLTILKELKLYDDACQLLDTEPGKAICAGNLYCDELRRELWKLKGQWKEEGERAQKRILDSRDRNWLEFLAVLDGVFGELESSPEDAEAAKTRCAENVAKARESFGKAVEHDGLRDRSGHLALIELEKRSRQHGIPTETSALTSLLESYFQNFADKACCFEDLRPYLELLEGEELSNWTATLEKQSSSFTSAADLQRYINAQKLLRYSLPASEITPERESARAAGYIKTYLDGLRFGTSLPPHELQPADDLAILAAQAFVSVYKLTGEEAPLFNAAAVLEYAITRSQRSFQARLHLIRIYRLLGASSLVIEHYRNINVKQVQNDTLSHFILSRASTFSLTSTGDLTYTTECVEASRIYNSNSEETSEFIGRAFASEKYSQIRDFLAFEVQLETSLQRDLIHVENVRLRTAHETLNHDLFDLELIELKFIFDRLHYDNRDFSILPSYQPRSGPSFEEQTRFFGKEPGRGWISAFLKIYIKAFQLASDLDDTVEEKLLIGDRPKPSADPEVKLPLSERLEKRPQEEVDDLTADEALFYEYATGLSRWLTPYHNYARPPPSVVLAEAAKQTELKTGQPFKALEGLADLASNGHVKKDEEPPAVTEAPAVINKYFDDMTHRIQEAKEGRRPLHELLHVVTLTQEAFLLFAVETVRFKPAAVVKVNKFGALVQSFKDIRAKAVAILKETASTLDKLAEEEASAERRKQFVEACKPITAESGLDHDFVFGVAKKVHDSRKQILDGVSKGILRVCKMHS